MKTLSHHLVALTLVMAVGLSAGCGGGESPVAGCVPGMASVCPCLGSAGATGVQTCLPDRTLGMCQCAVADGGVLDVGTAPGVDVPSVLDAISPDGASAMDVAADATPVDMPATPGDDAMTPSDVLATDSVVTPTDVPVVTDVGVMVDDRPDVPVSCTGTLRQLCGGNCVDLASDPAHCGGCNAACPAGQMCVGGTCGLTCSAPLSVCGSGAAQRCVNLQTDVSNCGSCGTACASGQSCLMGTCACPTAQSLCSGGCTSTRSDVRNCGGCGIVCPTGQMCVSGTCGLACSSPLSVCGSGASMRCLNLQSDASNCGACDRVCPSGQACLAGVCALVCMSPQSVCGTGAAMRCVSLQTDPANCGTCGRACASGQGCAGGACTAACPVTDLGSAVGSGVTRGTTSGTGVWSGSCGGSTAAEATFGWTAPSAGTWTFDTLGSAFDTLLYVRSGTCTGTELGCNDDSATSQTSLVTVTLTAGQRVAIVVDGFSSTSRGAFALNINPMLTCSAGQTRCGGGCVSVATDPIHCGACGRACAVGQYCAAGACVTCSAGAVCTPASNACHVGAVACAGGAASCTDTGASVSDGTACGSGGLCRGGTCMACEGGGSCAPTNPCRNGTVVCGSGGATCTESGSNVANGTACGAGRVCGNGVCNACVAGTTCTPSGNPCHTGATNCSTGSAACTDTGANLANGTTCGTGRVCSAGACVACVAGASCTPSGSPCHTGSTSCNTGTAVCVDTGSNAANGTSCGTGRVCGSGACVDCVAGASCVPSGNPCHSGTIACGSGAPVCNDSGTSLANGTTCGTGRVCATGSCVTCSPGGSCTPADPCAIGVFSCATGSQTCVSGGANPTVAGMGCGASGLGVCTGGACVCPAGSSYALGDCQACPAWTGTTAYVNADTAVGADNACCGRTNTRGFGGACLTVTQAYRNLGGTGWTISITGDAQRNASPNETYPIRLGRGVSIRSASPDLCFAGATGVPVFSIDQDASVVTILTGSFTIGTDCSGRSVGATDGIYVGNSAAGASSSVRIGQYVTIQGVVNGIHIDGGSVLTGGGFFRVTNVSNAGVFCRSDSRPSLVSSIDRTPYVDRAVNYDLFASTNCRMTVSAPLGVAGVCPIPKVDNVGIFVESNAVVATDSFFAGYFGVAGGISCMNSDGISLRRNPSLAVNSPTVTFSGQIRRSGCAGVYAEVGRVTINGSTISNNHWGVIQRSANSSTDPLMSLVNLTGTTSGGSISRNTFSCNNQSEPGACCTASSCPTGYNVWNNSGLRLDATNNYWEDSPVSVCSCPISLTGCTCAGAAFGLTTPPNDTSVVNSPPSASTTGTPVTLTTGAALVSTPSGCGLVSP